MNKPIVPREIHRVFEGRIFSVQVETLTLPNGHEQKAEIVRHPGAVVIIPITDSGQIIMVRQYRPAIGRFAWEFPAGSLKPSEDVQAAAARECQEEIGLVPSTLTLLGSFFPTPGYCDEQMHFYRADGLRKPTAEETAQPDEDEDIETKEFSAADVRRMIATGEVIDLKTVGGLALLAY